MNRRRLDERENMEDERVKWVKLGGMCFLWVLTDIVGVWRNVLIGSGWRKLGADRVHSF